MSSCLHFRVRGALSMCGGQSARHLWMAREEPTDWVFVVFFASSCVPFVRSFLLVDFWCTKFADGPYLSVGRSVSGRMVRGPIADGLLLRVQYQRFGGYFRTVHHRPTDRPPGLADGPLGACRWSAWCFAELAKSFAF
jgi:hypothetical protein